MESSSYRLSEMLAIRVTTPCSSVGGYRCFQGLDMSVFRIEISLSSILKGWNFHPKRRHLFTKPHGVASIKSSIVVRRFF